MRCISSWQPMRSDIGHCPCRFKIRTSDTVCVVSRFLMMTDFMALMVRFSGRSGSASTSAMGVFFCKDRKRGFCWEERRARRPPMSSTSIKTRCCILISNDEYFKEVRLGEVRADREPHISVCVDSHPLSSVRLPRCIVVHQHTPVAHLLVCHTLAIQILYRIPS